MGIGKSVRQRLIQHIVRRNSSVVTRISAVSLDPDKITEVRWALYPEYNRYLREAEIIALRVLKPVLRSRGAVSAPVEYIANRPDFRRKMKALFQRPPTGFLNIVSHEGLILKVEQLEVIIKKLKQKR